MKRLGDPDATALYRKPDGARTFDSLCRDIGTTLPRLQEGDYDTFGNKIPETYRAVYVRAAFLAFTMIRERWFREDEEKGVTNTRTAIHAAWQLVRWEGARPMETCDGESDGVNRSIDAVIAEGVAEKPGAEWEEARAKVNWQRVRDELLSLLIKNGVCADMTPVQSMPHKACHDGRYGVKKRQDPVGDEAPLPYDL